jgi:hypothetical protein
MRFFLLFFLLATFLTGCLETTQEITLNNDGSGVVSNLNDMSGLIGLISQMGLKDSAKLNDAAIDTTIALSNEADSLQNITPQEKELVKKGTLMLKMNMKESKFVTGMKFPFTKPSEIKAYNELTNKLMFETLKKQMGSSPMAGLEDMPAPSSLDDYFTTSFSNGILVKTLNKEKFAGVQNDEFLKAMKQSADMGLPMTATYIINLPRPAKKAEGKNVKLSDDRKKVTVVVDIDDFFDDPTKLEYRIEY